METPNPELKTELEGTPTAEGVQPIDPAIAPSPAAPSEPPPSEPPPSYVKLAMRNMVKKRGLSLQHFFLTTIGLLITFVGLAYLTR